MQSCRRMRVRPAPRYTACYLFTNPPMSAQPTTRDRIRAWVDPMETSTTRVYWFRLAFDGGLIAFFLLTTFVGAADWIRPVDYALGVVLAVEWVLRFWVARDRLGFMVKPLVIADLIVVLSLLAPSLTENFAFLRILRATRLLRSYYVLTELRSHSRLFRLHEAVIFRATHLLVFIFVVSAAVYALQVRTNPQIGNYMDALYFTVTTLTTTGFGDIVMVGSVGRMLSVVIMVVGVTLFLRLAQAIFRPPHVSHECPDCGLARHDQDAVHCKHCGRMLRIRTDGGGD